MEQWKIDKLKDAINNKDQFKIQMAIDRISCMELLELCVKTFTCWIKKKFKIIRKRSLFKNDFFGIKQKLFKRRVLNSLIKSNHLKADELACLLDVVTIINIPRNEEDENKLQWACSTYDSLMADINNEINRVRKRIS